MSEQTSNPHDSQATNITQETIETAIYFLKVNELQELADLAGLSRSGSKQSLIDRLLNAANATTSGSRSLASFASDI